MASLTFALQACILFPAPEKEGAQYDPSLASYQRDYAVDRQIKADKEKEGYVLHEGGESCERFYVGEGGKRMEVIPLFDTKKKCRTDHAYKIKTTFKCKIDDQLPLFAFLRNTKIFWKLNKDQGELQTDNRGAINFSLAKKTEIDFNELVYSLNKDFSKSYRFAEVLELPKEVCSASSRDDGSK